LKRKPKAFSAFVAAKSRTENSYETLPAVFQRIKNNISIIGKQINYLK